MEYKEIIEPIVTAYFEGKEIVSIDTELIGIQNELKETLYEAAPAQQYYPIITILDGVVKVNVLLVGYGEGENYIDELQIVLSEEYKVSTLNWKGTD